MAESDDFRAAWDDHHAAVRRYLARRAGRDAADDLLSGVFETAWRKWPEVPGGEAQLWWLLACARRLCANHSRSVTRRTSLLGRLAIRSGHPHLDQLMVMQCATGFGQHAFADPAVADQDHGLERVGEAAQVTPLFIV